MDRQPVLTGPSVVLRPLRADDARALFAAAADPLIWRQHPVPDRYTEAVFTPFFQEALESGGALVVIDTATGAVVGTSRFDGLDRAASEVEIGWTFLARSHWGGRVNGEVKRLMIDHALRFVDRVVFLVAPGNLRSRRAMEKISGIPTGTRTDPSGRQDLLYVVTGPRAPVGSVHPPPG